MTGLECLELRKTPGYIWTLYYAERDGEWLWMVRENFFGPGVTPSDGLPHHRAWGTLVDRNFEGLLHV